MAGITRIVPDDGSNLRTPGGCAVRSGSGSLPAKAYEQGFANVVHGTHA